MSRYLVVAPLLGWMIVGGCASTSDVAPTYSTAVELSTTVTPGRSCDAAPDGDGTVHAVGQPVAVKIKSESVTHSCRCEYTTTSDWGCSGAKHCESAYDVGDENPIVCERIDAVPATLPPVTATVYRSDCSAVVTEKDTSEGDVVVTCTTPGPVDVAVTVAGMEGQLQYVRFVFTPDGACPGADADGGASDGGASEGGDGGVDAGERGD